MTHRLDSIQLDYNLDYHLQEYIINILKKLLAKEYVLYVKTQNLHWNVTGMSFGSLHELFGKQYQELATFIDRIAEQIRKYGSASPGSMYEFKLLSDSQEFAGMIISQVNAVERALAGNKELVRFINSVDLSQLDVATQTLLGDLLDVHMKNAWMIRSYLE